MSKGLVHGALDRVLGGELGAYGEIIRTYQKEIRRIAAFALHDLESTEDLVQQVFVNAYFKLDQYDRGKAFGPWLRTMARNLVREELRHRSRHARRLEVYREHLLSRIEDHSSADRHEADLREALGRCREKLAPEAARAVDLRYNRSMGFQEMADLLGRTVAATRQMLGRIRLFLKDCIKERMAQG